MDDTARPPEPGETMSDRERVLWVLLFGVPPGIGVAGYTSVMFHGGALTLRATGAGLVTALVLGGLVGAALFRGNDRDGD
ncbi:MAG: hypothetical protein ABEJ30_04990 [Halorientalis sp.]